MTNLSTQNGPLTLGSSTASTLFLLFPIQTLLFGIPINEVQGKHFDILGQCKPVPTHFNHMEEKTTGHWCQLPIGLKYMVNVIPFMDLFDWFMFSLFSLASCLCPCAICLNIVCESQLVLFSYVFLLFLVFLSNTACLCSIDFNHSFSCLFHSCVLYHLFNTSLFCVSNNCIQVRNNLGWKRDLVLEGIEPNPGPSWQEFVEKLKIKVGEEDFKELQPFLTTLKEKLRPKTIVPHTDDILDYLNTNREQLERDRIPIKVLKETVDELKSKGKCSIMIYYFYTHFASTLCCAIGFNNSKFCAHLVVSLYICSYIIVLVLFTFVSCVVVFAKSYHSSCVCLKIPITCSQFQKSGHTNHCVPHTFVQSLNYFFSYLRLLQSLSLFLESSLQCSFTHFYFVWVSLLSLLRHLTLTV